MFCSGDGPIVYRWKAHIAVIRHQLKNLFDWWKGCNKANLVSFTDISQVALGGDAQHK